MLTPLTEGLLSIDYHSEVQCQKVTSRLQIYAKELSLCSASKWQLSTSKRGLIKSLKESEVFPSNENSTEKPKGRSPHNNLSEVESFGNILGSQNHLAYC